MKNEKEYKIVVMCGSTRFKDAFDKAKEEICLAGKIPIDLGIYVGDKNVTPEQLKMLINMHWYKMEMADEIYIVNKDGYIGEQTAKEIRYAKWLGKPIVYMEELENE